jgi:hypothetical protein
MLIKYPKQLIYYTIDQYWKILQNKDNWYLLTPLTVVQRPDISDIEKQQTNYIKCMLDLDKIEFRKYQSIKQKFQHINFSQQINDKTK